MYYEEKIIDGKLYCRSTPDGEWTEMSKVALTSLVTAARGEISYLRAQMEAFCA